MASRFKSLINLVIGSVLSLTGCSHGQKYEWLASESAPENYPMQIIAGYFECPDGYRQPIPSGKIVHRGWGNYVSIHIVGAQFKPLPNKIYMHWFSFRENKMFSGEFALPHDEIKKLFDEGFYGDQDGKETYHKLVAGVAPGGYLSIWATGASNTKLIAAFTAKEELQTPWKAVLDNPGLEREKYIQSVLERNKITGLNGDIPFGLWEAYKTSFDWQPKFNADKYVGSVRMYFLNGEQVYIDYTSNHPLNLKSMELKKRPVLSEIILYWIDEKKVRQSRKIIFDKDEIFNGFNSLAKEGKSIDVYFELDSKKYTKVFLKCGENTIQLKSLKEESFAINQDVPALAIDKKK